MKFFYLLSIFLFISYNLSAATITWTNTSGDGLWSNAANWDIGLPVAADDVVFDGTSNSNCNVDASVTVNSVTINAGYTSTLTQFLGNTISISGDFVVASGNFVGGNSNIQIGNTLNIQAGIFTATSASIGSRHFTLNPAGTYNHNNGSYIFSGGASFNIDAIASFNNLRITANANITTTLTATSELTVLGNFTFSGTGRNNLNTGKVLCEGDVLISQSHTANAGSGTIELSGNNNQTITSTVTAGQGELPNFIINKSGGSATFDGIFSFGNNFTHSVGTVDFTTNTTTMYFGDGNATISGSFNAYNLTFNSAVNCTYSVLNEITTKGRFTTANSGRGTINTGKIICEGDIQNNNTNNGNSGNATIEISGTNNQNIISTATLARGELPNVIINKTGGTATFTGIISAYRNWTYIAGNTDYATNASTIALTGTSATVSGNQTLYNFRIHPIVNNVISILNTVTVSNDFSFSGTARCNINTGTIECHGDIIVANSNNGNTGNATIKVCGAGAQLFSSSVTLALGELPNIVIDKPSGMVTFSGIISAYRNWTFTTGDTDYSTNTSTIALTGGNAVVNGNQNFYNFRIHPAANNTINILNTITVNNIFAFSATSRSHINTGEINCLGNIIVSNSSTANLGNATIKLSGANVQNFTSNVTLGQGELPNIIIDKSGGSVIFDGVISFLRDWTLVTGVTDFSTNNSTIATTYLNQTFTGANVFHNLTFNNVSGSNITVADDIITEGLFTFRGGRTHINGPSKLLLEGDMLITNLRNDNAGTGTIEISGNANQTLTSNVNIGLGELPNIIVNKSGGTATFDGTISFIRDWTYIAGITDYNTNNSTIATTYLNQTFTGTNVFHNLTFNNVNGANITVADDIITEGLFTFRGGRTHINGPSKLLLEGDMLITNIRNDNAGTGTIEISGSANQTLTSNVNISLGELPNIVINKSGGTATFDGTISFIRDWTYIAGITDYSTNNSTIATTAQHQTFTGANVFHNLTFNNVNGSNITIADDTKSTGLFTFSGARTHINGPSKLLLEGDMLITNIRNDNAGTGTIEISGGVNQTLTSNVSIGLGELPNIIFNKTGGTATFNGNFTFNRNFEFVQGLADNGTNSSLFASFGSNTTIDGESNTGTDFEFFNLYLNTANNITQTLLGNFTVNNNFSINSTRLNLNGNEVTVNNPDSSAVTYTVNRGNLISETSDNGGKLSWNIGSNAENHIFPFATSGNTRIPFEFQVTDGGDVGMVSVATYPVAINNTPYPVSPELVTNLSNSFVADNSTNVIDRFWQIDKSGPSGTATMLFTYTNADVSGGVVGNENLLEAQRYESSTDYWADALPGQSASAVANQVRVPGVTTFSPWTLALSTNPLPVELISFNALAKKEIVNLDWQTESEINNEKFVVQRSSNGFDFDNLLEVSGAGTSSEINNYSAVDYQPFSGTSYYRLKQIDFDGGFEYSDIKSVSFESNKDVSIYPNPANGNSIINVNFNNSKSIPYQIELLDASGKLVYKTINIGKTNQLTTSNLSPGVYFVRILGIEESITKRVILGK